MACPPPCGCNPPCGLPTCGGCGEDHGGNTSADGTPLCRECNLEYLFTRMQCSECLQYRYDPEPMGELWGKPCTCNPPPPTIWESRDD